MQFPVKASPYKRLLMPTPWTMCSDGSAGHAGTIIHIFINTSSKVDIPIHSLLENALPVVENWGATRPILGTHGPFKCRFPGCLALSAKLPDSAGHVRGPFVKLEEK